MSAASGSLGGPAAPNAWNTVQTQLRCCRTRACHVRYPDNGHHHCCSRCRLGGGRGRHSRRCRQVQRDLVEHPPTLGTFPPSMTPTASMTAAPSMASTAPATNMAMSSTTPSATANLATEDSWRTAHNHRWNRGQRPQEGNTPAPLACQPPPGPATPTTTASTTPPTASTSCGMVLTVTVAAAPAAPAFSLNSLDDDALAGYHMTQDVAVVDLTADDDGDTTPPPEHGTTSPLFTFD